MEFKPIYMGKTVLEMIARLEEHEEYCRRSMNGFFTEIVRTANETYNRFEEMTEDQKLANYKKISNYAQHLLVPTPPAPNYRNMPNEELIEHYKMRKYYDDCVKEFYAREAAESKKSSMCNRVKTAINGLFESMKKRIGKKNF
ncbi:hypothetical protein B9Z55_011567 [Caenorhabditis nigoni]|uniref:Uncharacterized protein n=1 Tax=Caenorhabditis nigoni TaxID=1611254 RepID=A0A2G5UKK5_9PELO|nr:hypothetical protein B9Z55_011567 [Caenorhabditis nigoni]